LKRLIESTEIRVQLVARRKSKEHTRQDLKGIVGLLDLRYILRKIAICMVPIPFVFCFFIIFLPIARIRKYLKRRKGMKPCIIWGPTPILTASTNSKAERLFEYKSRTLVYSTYYLTRTFDYDLEKFFHMRIFRVFVPWLVFLWAVINYDIFHFFFDRGFLPTERQRGINRLELPLLKLAGKNVIVSAYGGDVRYESKSRSGGKFNCCIDCDQRLRACICSETLAISNINYINRFADLTLSMGDMQEYTPGSRNDVFYWAIDLGTNGYVGVEPKNVFPIKIVHAPNHRQFKGTKYLVDTVDRLKKLGYEIELQLIERICNKEAVKLYRGADIVAEQFIIGWHGYLAVEAMALGKPVVCFIRKPNEYLPLGKECPIVNATPDTLEDTLRWLIENPDVRVELGKKGRAYVEEVFSLESVGKRLDQIYKSIWR
jgi:glycosyltransferase involved in cell wall biosynthesis